VQIGTVVWMPVAEQCGIDPLRRRPLQQTRQRGVTEIDDELEAIVRRYGILTRGSTATLIDRNEVEHNRISSLGPARGISVEASTNVNVIGNDAFENVIDLFWDGTGSADQFRHNECDTSQPPGLCDDGGGRADTSQSRAL
jgi:hypothetical protein